MSVSHTVDQAIANKAAEIVKQAYARYIVSEDVIERNFGYKIIRQQVSSGRNSLIYKCETTKQQGVFCMIKAYKLGKDHIQLALREETCQIMRYVAGRCAQVISTYDIFYTNDKIYLMCDWTLKGEVVSNVKSKEVRLNESLLQIWAIDLLNALNFLHSNAISHRNISPHCLLLTHDNHVKIGTLSDAVIYCKPDGSLIRQKWPKFSRTKNWNQGPEVAKSDKRDYDPRRADIWSLGATIFWFITGQHPINYRTNSKLNKNLESRMSLMHKVSNKCMAFVKALLAYQPVKRPNVEDALLLQWVADGPSTNTSPGGGKAKEVEIGITEKGEVDPADAEGPDEGKDPSSSSKRAGSNGRRESSTKSPAQDPAAHGPGQAE